MPVHVGDFTLDESTRQLLRRGEPMHLSPKAFQLLSVLIRQSPRAISKTDLQEELWPDTFVNEGNLPSLVTELRSALGDDAREPRFIRTLYGFGYSFAAQVDEQPSRVAQEAIAPPASKWRLRGMEWAAAALLILGGLVLFSLRTAHGTTRSVPSDHTIHSIAVLPFDTSGSDPADAHLAVGLPDLLITRLTNVQHLVVRPTSSIRRFADHHADSREAGRDLKVDAVLEGSVRTTADRVRVTVQLLDVREQKPIWADRFDEKRAEMFTIEDEISERVAKALMVQVTAAENALLAKRYTTNPEAYEAYIEGRYRLIQAGSAGANRTARSSSGNAAVEFFQKAAEKDPRYALAWGGIGQAYAAMGWYGNLPPATAYPRAEAAARKALELDDSVCEAHIAMGTVDVAWYLDYAAGEKEFSRAVELSPKDPSPYINLAHLVQSLGRFDEAIAIRKQAVDIDPLNQELHWGLANAYLTARRYDEAEREVAVVLGMNPNHYEAHIAQIRIASARGKFDEAIAIGQKLVATDPQNSRGLSFLCWAYGVAGKKAEAKATLETMRKRIKESDLGPFPLAVSFIGVGDRDAALRELNKGVDERSYALRLKTEPVFDPLRSDPRFIALLHKAGFKD